MKLLAPVGGDDGRGLDIIEVREIFFQVGVAFHLNATLIRSMTAELRRVAIPAVNFVHHVHSFGHFAERRETLPIETGVVAEVDEQLRGARVWTGGGKSDGAARVAALDGVVWYRRFAPLRGDVRVAVDAELAHEAGNHTEEGDVRKVAGTNQVVKTVRAVGRKRAGDFNGEFPSGRVELCLESLRRLLGELGGISKAWRGGRRLLRVIRRRFVGRLCFGGAPAQKQRHTGGKAGEANPHPYFHRLEIFHTGDEKSRTEMQRVYVRAGGFPPLFIERVIRLPWPALREWPNNKAVRTPARTRKAPPMTSFLLVLKPEFSGGGAMAFV